MWAPSNWSATLTYTPRLGGHKGRPYDQLGGQPR
jgi:hypothetical protein